MNIIIVALLALSLMSAPTIITSSVFAGNGDDDDDDDSIIKKEKAKQQCLVKVQVKLFGAANSTIYTVQLDDLLPQAKQTNFNQTEIDSGDNNQAFVFQYKKAGGDSCPEKGDIEEGNVDGVPFAVVINYLTKMNKIGIDLTQ